MLCRLSVQRFRIATVQSLAKMQHDVEKRSARVIRSSSRLQQFVEFFDESAEVG